MNVSTGEVISAKIERVTPRSGIGSVKVGHDTVSIGPVKPDAAGSLVQLKYLGEKQINENTFSKMAICLTDQVLSDDYEDYIRNQINTLLPDEPPQKGEITYAEIDYLKDGDIGVTKLGGREITLGPVNAEPGDLVKIQGATDTHARVISEASQGQNYEIRFSILAGFTKNLPVSEGEEFTTVISEVVNGELTGYVGDVPIRFPDDEVEMAQKVDGLITGFSGDMVVGKVLKRYEDPGRIANPGHWARVQWLRKIGFEKDPFESFAAAFIGTTKDALPQETDLIKDALVAESVRLALEDKREDSDEGYARAHVTGIRHWAVHKLNEALGDPVEIDTDWFRATLTERNGPTLEFLGDVLELSKGYYAQGPTRAVSISNTEAILISGRPSWLFFDQDLEIEFRGINRIITDTSQSELGGKGIPIQSKQEYIYSGLFNTFGKDFLNQFIESRQHRDWIPESDWTAYPGNHGFGFEWDEDPLTVGLEDGRTVSLWQVPSEYGADEYQLKIEAPSESDAKMVEIPAQYYRQVGFILDSISGIPRRAELTESPSGARLSCDFVPPRAQMRWINAIGAKWEDPRTGKIHWSIEEDDIPSIKEVLDDLAIEIKDTVTGDVN